MVYSLLFKYFFGSFSFTTWNVPKYGDFSGPYFPTVGLNTERYGVSLRTQSEFGKCGPEKTPYLDTFHVMVTITTRAIWFLKSVPKFIPIIDIFFLFVVNHSVTLEFNEIVIHFSLARSILKLPYFLQIFFVVKKSFKIALFCEFLHGYQQLVCQYE